MIWLVLFVIIYYLNFWAFGYDENINIFGCFVNLHSDIKTIECLTRAFKLKPVLKNDIVHVILLSPQIYSYAANNAVVNSVYFQKLDAVVRILSDNTGDDFNPQDRRWNKIKSIPNALTGWAVNCSYIVFMDADLIILSDTFDVQSIINNNSQADLIMSADTLDSANTGFMIVRNTPWSIDFFSRWWDMRHTANTFCDQHVLNRLVAELKDTQYCTRNTSVCMSDFSRHISILDHKALNSQWPAIEHFAPTDQVLHLMGETRATRDAVMAYAANVVRAAVGRHAAEVALMGDIGPIVFPKQFGLTRSILRDLASTALIDELHSQLAACRQSSAVDSDFEALHAGVSHLCADATKYSSDDPGGVEDALSLCLSMLREAYIMHCHHLALMENLPSHGRRLFHFDQMTMLLFDSMRHSADGERKEVIAGEVLTLLDQVAAAVDLSRVENKVYLHHKRGIVFGARSEYFQSLGLWARSLELERVAESEYRSVLELVQSESDHPDINSFILEHVYSSFRLSVAYQRLGDLKSSVEWSRSALLNGQRLFAHYSADQRLIDAERSRLATQHVSVCSELGLVEEAKENAKLVV
jgi:hypothetical protein